MKKIYVPLSKIFDKIINPNRFNNLLIGKALNRILIAFFMLSAFAVSQQSMGQAASSTWTLTSSVTPAVVGAVTATAPTFGTGLLNTGNLDATYGSHATNWPITTTFPIPTSSTKYIQFSVTPTGTNSLNLTSLTMTTQTPESFDRMVIIYSTDPTFASSTQIGNAGTYIVLNSGTFTPPVPAFSATAASGQTLYFRVYFYYTSTPGIEVGIRSLALSGTTAAPVNTITTGTITGSPFCAGSAVSVPFTSVGTYTTNTYTAQLSNAVGSFAAPTNIGTLVSNANSGIISATIPAATATGAGYRIRVVSSNPAVTGSDNGSNITINTAPNITGSSLAAQTLCQNTSATALSVTATGSGLTYQWYSNTTSSNTGGTIISGATSASFTPPTTTPGTLYYYCIVSGSCTPAVTSAVSGAIIVNPFPVAAGAITGTTPVCQGQNGVAYSVPVITNATGYVWTLPTGATIATGANTNSITVNYSVTATSGNITVYGTNACGNGTVSANYAVTVNPLPVAAGAITGTTPVCQVQNGVAYSVPAITNATGYVWTLPTGATIATGANTNSITVNYSVTATSGNITVYGTNACGNGTVSANYAVTVNPLPVAAGAITGTTPVCQGQNGVAYSIPAITNATGYVWTLPTGATIATGANTNSITVNYSVTATSGNITVYGTNACGNGTVSANYAVTVNPLPVAAGAITGTAPVCQGQSGVAYSVPAITNATGYVWTLPTGATIATGANTNSITVNYSVTATSGNITVYGTNACGNGTVSANYAVTVNPLPVAAGAITGTTPVCQGQSGVAYSVPTIINATSYTWAYTGTGATITGTGNSITIDFSAAATSGNLTVTGVNSCGNGTISANYPITVNQPPVITTDLDPTPQTVCATSNVSYSVVASGTALTYQWFRSGVLISNGGRISGATSSTLTITGVTAADNGTYQVVVSGASPCSPATSASAPLIVDQRITFTTQPVTPQTICQGSTYTIFAQATGTVATYQWYHNGNPSLQGTFDGSDKYTLTIPNVTTDSAGTYRLLLDDGTGIGCTAANSNIATLVVNPTPVATISGTTTVCQSSTPAPLVTFTNPEALPVTITYNINTGSNLTINVAANTTATVAAPTGNVGTFAYNLISVAYQSGPACSNPITGTATITVNPTPSVTAKMATPCSNTAFSVTPVDGNGGDIVPAGTTYSWSAPVVTGGITGGVSGTNQTSISGTLTNPTNTNQTATYTVTPTSGSCIGSNFTVTVTVTSTPSVVNQTTTTCSGSGFTVTPSNGGGNIVPAGTTYSWSAPTVTGGMTGGTTGTNAASITGTLTNPTSTAQTATYTVTPLSGSCMGANFTVTVTVNPTPSVTTSQTATTCSATGFSVTPTDGSGNIVPAGTTYSWSAPTVTGSMTGGAAGINQTSISGTLTNPTNTNQTATYTVTPKSGSCTGSNFTVIVTVNPKATIAAKTQTICSGSSFSVTPINGTDIVPAGTTYSWSAPVVTGGITGGVSGTNQTSISGTLINPTNTNQTATYTVTPTSGSCIGSNFTVTVTVTSTPSVVNQTTTTCSGSGFTVTPSNGGGNIVPAGTTYSWSAPTVTGGMTGGTTGTNAASITGTLTNPTSTAQTATYTVTPLSGSCMGANFTVTVTVNPTPSVTTSQTATTCSATGFSVTPTDGSGNIVPAGTTYSWSAPTVTGSMTGGAAGINQTSISGTLTNPTNTNQTATYTVTPKSGSCTGSNFTVIVTVNPKATIAAKTQTICSGSSFSVTPINGTDIVPAGTTYSWSAPVVTGGITGGVSGTNQTSISGTLINPTNTNQTATYTVTPTSGSCIGSNFTVTVTVTSTPSVVNQTTTTCSGSGFTVTPSNGGGNIVPAGTTYSWSAPTVTGGMTGGTTGTNAASITGTLNNATATTQTATYTVTPKSGSCSGSNFTVTVTVNPLPTITTTGVAAPKCFSASAQSSTLVYSATTQSPTTYSINWASGIANVTNAALPASPITIPIPAGLAPGTYTGTLTVKNSNGCISGNVPVSIIINALPTPTLTNNPASPVCANTNVTYTSDAGQSNYIWTFSGTAGTDYTIVSGGNSTSSTAVVDWMTPGTKTVTVNYTNGNTCTAVTATSNSITVLAVPTGSVTVTENSGLHANDNIICAGDAVTFTAPSGYGSYTFYVNGTLAQGPNTNNTYSTTTLPASASVTVNIANASNCGATFTAPPVTVNPVPAPTLQVTENSGTPNDNTICPNSPVTLTVTPVNAGSTYSFLLNGTNVNTGSSNSYTVTNITSNSTVAVMETNANGCQKTTATQNITVSPVPSGTLTVSPGNSFCAGTAARFTATAGPTGTTYNFKVNGTSTYTASNVYTTTTLNNGDIVTVDVTNSNGCTTTLNPIAVTVNPPPTGTLTATENSGTPNDYQICSGAPVTFIFSTTGYQTYNFKIKGISKQSNGSNTFITTALMAGDVVTVDITTESNCTASFTAPAVTVNPSPSGTLTPSANPICKGDNATFTASSDPSFTNYNFKVNGQSVQNGNGNTYSSTTFANNDTVTVDVTNNSGCISTFGPVIMTVNAVPGGTLTVSPGNTICKGTSTIFNAPTGFANYDFQLNGLSVQSGPSPTYTTASLANSDKVSVAVKNASNCIVLLNTITMVVNPVPANSPITGTTNVCAGSITALSDATSGGTWSSLNPSIATVDASGNVTGVAAGTATINYKVTSAFGCDSSVTANVTVFAVPVVAAITGTVKVCVGNTSALSDATGGGTWSSGTPAVATVNSATGVVTGVTAGNSIISYSVTNGNGCTDTVKVTVTVYALPVVASITVKAPATTFDVCVGSTIGLADATAGGTWSSSATTIATVNTSTGIVTGVADGTSTISYTVTDANGCSTTVTQNVNVHALPTPTLNGPNPICPNTIGTYTTESGFNNYTWTFTGGTLVSGGSTTDNTITILWDQPGTKTVHVNYSNSFGCSGATSVTVTSNSGTPPTLSGTSPVCLNSNGTYQTNGGQSNYTWSAVGGTITAGGTSNIATINWTTSGTDTVKVNFADVNGCTASDPAVLPVTVNTLPTATVTGTTAVCTAPGTQPLITFTGATGTAPYTFIYTINGGSNQTVTTTSGNSIIVNVPTGTAGSFVYALVNVADANSCSQSQSGSATVTVTAPPSATINYAGSPYCTSASAASVTQTGTSGGTYSAASGLSINSADGTITPATSTPGTYIVTYSISTGGACGVYTTTTSVTITAAPSATIAYSGGPFCTTASPVNVAMSGTAGGTYTSTVGLTINSSTGTITPSTSTGGTYTVNYTIAASGGCAAFSATTTVTITTAPSAAISYSGGAFCSNAAPVNATRTGAAGGTYSAGAGLSINAGTGTITPSSSTPGTYTVTYTVAASGGCSVYSTTTSVTITAAPTGALSGTQQICSGNSATLTIAATGSGTISGTLSPGGIAFSGTAPTISIVVNPGSTTNYTIATLNDATGCVGTTSGSAMVTVNPPTTLNNIAASPSTICQGSSTNLTASTTATNTLLSENFEGTPSFTVINYATSQRPTMSQWLLENSPYSYNGNFSVVFSSGSKFMLANSDDPNHFNNRINTTLNSSVISTMGYTSLTLSYRTYYGSYSADNFVGVEVSTDGGTTWVTAQTLNSTQGAPGTFVSEVVNLSSYINNSSFQVRFRYQSNNGIAWGLDDISLTGTSAVGQYSWIATPSANSGLPASAATPSLSNSSIIATPTAAGTYIYKATLTNASGCTSAKSVNVTVNPSPTVSIIADYCSVPNYVVLTATHTVGSSLLWSTGKTTDTIHVDVAGNYTAYATSGGCTGSATISVANELVINGNFELGNFGFTSAYPYRTGAGSLNNPPGYAVDTAANYYGPSFLWGKDHTTGHGKFMMVNGAAGPNYQVWQETLNVLPNTTYYFSAWGLELDNLCCNPANAILQFNVNGAQVGTFGNLPRPNNPKKDSDNNGWVRFYGSWTSGPTTTSVIVSITDLQGAVYGNNFGLDDISFGTLSTFINLISPAGTDAQTICINNAIQNIVYSAGSGASSPTVTGLPAGVTPSWNGVYLTISGTPTVAGNYSYTITTTGSCQPSTATGTITVQEQEITLSSGSASPTVCVNAPVSIGYTLSGTATNATVRGLPGATTSLSGNVFTINWTPSAPGSYPDSVITSGTTCTPDTVIGTITVQSQTITLSSAPATTNQTVCINSGITNIQYAIGGTGTGATVSGLPSGVTGKYQSGIFIISGTPTQSGTFISTITTSGTCSPGATAKDTINVTPAASLTLTSQPGTDAQAVCQNTAITDITYSVSNATSASITSGALPAGVNGSYSGGVFKITGTPTVNGTFNYTITTSGGCAFDTKSGSITVNGINLTSGVASPSLCANTPMTNIVYTISGTVTSVTPSGLPTGVTGSLSGNVYTISGSPNVAPGSYPYTITSTGSCASLTASGTITITPGPNGGTLASALICGGSSGNITLSGQVGTIQGWQSSTDGGTTWNALPPNTTITQSYTNITQPTQYRVAVSSSGCSIAYSTVGSLSIYNYWTGGTSTDWNTASNWSGNVVPSTTCANVYIPAGLTYQPTLGSGTATITNLIIYPGGQLTVSGATLQIAGTINNTGTFIASNGTLEFNGTSPQSITAGLLKDSVKDVIISNTSAGGVTLGGQLDVYDAITYGASGTTLNTGGFLALKSNAATTARIGDLTGHNITGAVTVERYINTGLGHGKAWEFLATPTQGQTVNASWMEGNAPGGNSKPGFGTQITSPFGTAAGFDRTSLAPSMKYYDPAAPLGFTGIANTGIQLYDQRGYMLFVRGDRSVDGSTVTTPTPTVLRSKGSLFIGPKTIAVGANGFGSIGNPFASAIDMTKVMGDRTGVLPANDNFFTVWDPYATGSYGVGAYITFSKDPVSGNYIGTPGGATNNNIQSGQAFFVQNTGASAFNMVFKEPSKTTGSNVTFFRPMGTSARIAQLRTDLYSATNVLADGTLQQFSEDYSNAVDGMDGRKFFNSSENLYIKSGGKNLIVERRKMPVEQDTIFFSLTSVKVANYHFEFTASNLSSAGVDGFVEDAYVKTRTPLNMEGKTELNFAVTSDAASYAANRFMIVFKTAAGPLPVTLVSVKAYPKNADVAVEWKVDNESNMKQYEVEKSTDGSRFNKAATLIAMNTGSGTYNWLDQHATPGYNYYRIRSIDMNGKVDYTQVVKVLIQLITPEITIYPNPITDGVINLHLINQPAGKYFIRMLNPLGQLILSKQVTHAEGTTIEPIQWNYNLAHGTYQLEITKPNGELKVIKVMY